MIKNLLKKVVLSMLLWESKLILKKYSPYIIAITGTVGKTTTKDAIYEVLKASESVRRNEKSYNSEFGLPLTIINRMTAWESVLGWTANLLEGLHLIIFKVKYPKILILEASVGVPGDMKYLTKIIKPDIALLTGLSSIPVHVEFFESPEALTLEKELLFKALRPGGLAILNRDDERAYSLRETLTGHHIITYGFHATADFRASQVHVIYDEQTKKPIGTGFRIDYQGKSAPVRLSGVLGMGAVYASIAAFVIGSLQNKNVVEIAESLGSIIWAPGRCKIIDGIKETTIIDDSYNSSPKACEASILALESLEISGRKIAVLGDMTELGKFTKEAHEDIGRLAVGKVDYLMLIGQRAHFIGDGAKEAGFPEDNIININDSVSAGEYLQNFVQQGDAILIKGSQAVRMEKCVVEIMAEPERREELLVRQSADCRDDK